MQHIKSEDSNRNSLLLERIKKGEESCIKELYHEYRTDFLKWSKYQYNLDLDTAIDVFQDCMIILYSNVVNGKLTELSSSIKTYIYSIAKNQILKRMNKNDRLRFQDQSMDTSDVSATDGQLELSERQVFIKEIMESIGEPCKSILKLFYFKRYSMEAIAQTLKYKNENVVKSQKLRCINELKDKVSKNYTIEDL